MNQAVSEKTPAAVAIDIAIKLGILVLILAWCFQILQPFLQLIAWGGIIAIAVRPLIVKLTAMLGGRFKLALALFVVFATAIIVVPMWLFTSSLIETALGFNASVEAGTFTVRPPNDSVRDWPLIGERTYAAWSELSSNLSEFIADNREQIRNIAQTALRRVAGFELGALQFLISIFIAAAFLATTETVTRKATRVMKRLSGDHAEQLRILCVSTVRSIAVGVLGIAFVQALASGVGIALVGLPAVGLWALIVLILAIVQLPPLLILLPLAVYTFSIQSTGVAVAFAIWCLIVSASDAVLKPLLLGRGVDAPMLVILLGAIGGMITSGIIGLFTGAVVLGMSYKLLQIWLGIEEIPAVVDGEPGTSTQ